MCPWVKDFVHFETLGRRQSYSMETNYDNEWSDLEEDLEFTELILKQENSKKADDGKLLNAENRQRA